MLTKRATTRLYYEAYAICLFGIDKGEAFELSKFKIQMSEVTAFCENFV